MKKLIFDLSLRFTTAKNVLTALEEEWVVEKEIRKTRGVIAMFRISPTTTIVPPEWKAEYGKHPYGL